MAAVCAWMAVVVSDKGLKLEAGTYVVQVGKRKFARVHLSLFCALTMNRLHAS
jgi:hypothetical protein